MSNNNTKNLFKLILCAGMALGSSSVFAADGCVYLPLVTNIIEGQQQTPPVPTANTVVCVDIPVRQNYERALFNIDSLTTRDGTTMGTPVALRHMYMLGVANMARAKSTPDEIAKLGDFHIKGVIHGKSLTWALSDQWWIDNVPGATGNPHKEWLNKINGLRAKGLDIQLEVCGVTMYGKGLTQADLYPGILVNQGAVGRILYLQNQEDYAYIQSGYIDNDSASLIKGDNSGTALTQ